VNPALSRSGDGNETLQGVSRCTVSVEMGSSNRVGSPESEDRPAVTTMEAPCAHRGRMSVPLSWIGLREGLPLRRADWPNYLDWAVKAFRLATSSILDQTQIHTHMCYCEFADILPSIAALDADVISMETARSRMELLEAFKTFGYRNQIGPGVYDIHSPCVPSIEEMRELLTLALDLLQPEQIWVNPDCGLKTSAWLETISALENMCAAAARMRTQLTE
jgi:5-methyltetrahydropteroyltriglutamate--homocysteine methyltransferase